MAIVVVERLGGLAGFGLPRSRIRSRGEVDPERLGVAEREALDSLFARSSGEGELESATPARDAFVYVLTREGDKGPEIVRLPEKAVPAFVSACVTDELI